MDFRKTALLMFIFLCFAFVGCTNGNEKIPNPDIMESQNIPESINKTDTTPAGFDNLQLIKNMMILNCDNMSVTNFNTVIQKICTDAGTNIFDVIASAYDRQDDIDKDLYAFMQTTLAYSMQQIYGETIYVEPVYVGNAVYITTKDMTATDFVSKKETMPLKEWVGFIESISEQITINASIHYAIKFDIVNSDSLMIIQRDETLNKINAEIQSFLANLNEEVVQSNNIAETLIDTFAQFAVQNSDDAIILNCELLTYEVNGELIYSADG